MCAGLKWLDVKIGRCVGHCIVFWGILLWQELCYRLGYKGQNLESCPQGLHTNEVGIDMQIKNMPREGSDSLFLSFPHTLAQGLIIISEMITKLI